jgi:hypothetical protein
MEYCYCAQPLCSSRYINKHSFGDDNMEFDHHEPTSLDMTSVKLAMRGVLLFTRNTFLSRISWEDTAFLLTLDLAPTSTPRVADPDPESDPH